MKLRQSSLFSHSVHVLFAQIVIFVSTFVLNIIIARVFGPSGKGVYSLIALSGLLLYAFSNLGLSNSFVYYVAKDRSKTSEYASFALMAGAVLGMVFAGVFFVVYHFGKHSFLTGIGGFDAVLIALSLPCYLSSVFLTNLLLGEGNVTGYNLSRLIPPLLLLVIFCGSLVFTTSRNLLIIPWFTANIAAFFCALFFFRRTSFTGRFLSTISYRDLFSYGIKGYIADLVGFFTYRLDFFLVNYFLDSSYVGIYSISVAVAELLWYIPNSIQTILMPKVASMTREEANGRVPDVCKFTLYLTLGLSVVLLCVASQLIPLVYGKQFNASVMPLLLILPGIISLAVSKVVSAYLMGRGKPIYSTYVSIFSFVVITILDIILIPLYRLNGAAIASSIAYSLSTLVAISFFCKESGVSIKALVMINSKDVRYVSERLMVTFPFVGKLFR